MFHRGYDGSNRFWKKKYIIFIRYLICNTRCMYFHGHMNHQRGILFYLQSFHSRDFTVDANAFFTLACHFSSILHLCFFGVSPCIAQKLSLLMNYVPLKPFTIVYSKKTFLKIRFSFLFVRFLKPVFRFDIWVAKLSFSEQFFSFRNDSTCVWSEIYDLNVVPEKNFETGTT